MFIVMKLFFSLLLFKSFVSVDLATVSETMTISLDKKTTFDNKEVFGDFVTLNKSEVLMITFTNINPNISFVILQVHSVYPVTLYKNNFKNSSMLTGQHIGFHSDVVNAEDVFYLTNTNDDDVSAYVSVHGYTARDPIPGGCSLTSPVAPNLEVRLNGNNIMVYGYPAQSPRDPECIGAPVPVKFYMMYRPELDSSAENYYDSIRGMMTWYGIRKNGIMIPQTYPNWLMRRMLSAYPAVGVAVVAVAFTPEGISVYIPNHTYVCDSNDPLCVWNDYWMITTFAVCVFAASTLLCFMGHRHFKSEMFCVAFITGSFICGIIFTVVYDDIDVILMLCSMFIGVVFACLWLLAWFIYGIPIIAVLLAALDTGFLVAALFYYRMPSGLDYLQSDLNFWTLYMLMMLLVALSLVSVPYIGNIISCSLLGSYGIVVALDMLMGSNLKYIVVNVVRRATTKNFNKAVVMPPFQTSEKTLVALWAILAIAGLMFQYWYNHGRPRFPASPLRNRANPAMYGTYNGRNNSRTPAAVTQTSRNNERTPLLG